MALGVLKITFGVLINTFGVTTITLGMSNTPYCDEQKKSASATFVTPAYKDTTYFNMLVQSLA